MFDQNYDVVVVVMSCFSWHFHVSAPQELQMLPTRPNQRQSTAVFNPNLCWYDQKTTTTKPWMQQITRVQKQNQNHHKTASFPGHVEQASSAASLFKLPLLSAHGALLLHLLGVEPLQDAVHVEAVGALAPHQRAVVPRYLTCTGVHSFIHSSGTGTNY